MFGKKSLTPHDRATLEAEMAPHKAVIEHRSTVAANMRRETRGFDTRLWLLQLLVASLPIATFGISLLTTQFTCHSLLEVLISGAILVALAFHGVTVINNERLHRIYRWMKLRPVSAILLVIPCIGACVAAFAFSPSPRVRGIFNVMASEGWMLLIAEIALTYVPAMWFKPVYLATEVAADEAEADVAGARREVERIRSRWRQEFVMREDWIEAIVGGAFALAKVAVTVGAYVAVRSAVHHAVAAAHHSHRGVPHRADGGFLDFNGDGVVDLIDLNADGIADVTVLGTPVQWIEPYVRSTGLVNGHYRTIADSVLFNNLSNLY
jgi:hypothetical protein